MFDYIKILVIVIISIIGQNNNEILINDFVEKFLLNENYDVNKIENWVNIKPETLTRIKNEKNEYFQYVMDNIQNEVSEGDGYTIVNHTLMAKDSRSKNLNLNYDKMENVYYLLSGEKIVTTIIIRNNKIISFYYAISKKEDRNYPAILN